MNFNISREEVNLSLVVKAARAGKAHRNNRQQFCLNVKEDNLDLLMTAADCKLLATYAQGLWTQGYKKAIKGFTATKATCKEEDWQAYRADQKYIERFFTSVAEDLFPAVEETKEETGSEEELAKGEEDTPAQPEVNLDELLATIEAVCKANPDFKMKVKAIVDAN